MDIEESGEILFKDQNHLKWIYTKPDVKIFVLDGDLYRFYDEDNEQLRLGKAIEGKGQWFWQIFFSDELAPFIQADENSRMLHIKKNDPDEPLDIQVWLNDRHLPYKVFQVDDNLKIHMVFLFSEYKENVTPTPGEFEIKVPQNVDIVDEV